MTEETFTFIRSGLIVENPSMHAVLSDVRPRFDRPAETAPIPRLKWQPDVLFWAWLVILTTAAEVLR